MGGLILNCLFLIFDVGIYFGVFLMILSPTITSNMHQKIAICKDCGTSFPFSASNEIAGYKASRMKLVVFFTVIAVVIYLIAPIWQRM